jgi:hypothetical protein
MAKHRIKVTWFEMKTDFDGELYLKKMNTKVGVVRMQKATKKGYGE